MKLVVLPLEAANKNMQRPLLTLPPNLLRSVVLIYRIALLQKHTTY